MRIAGFLRSRFRLPLLLLALAVAGVQAFVIWQIERQVLEPIHRHQGGLSVADHFSAGTRALDPESFDRKWFSGHHAIEVPDPAATLHVWRFDPWHSERGETDRDARATVLLMPGWGGTAMKSEYLFLLAQVLRAESCRVFLVDLRGQGCASGDTCSYGYLDAKDLTHLVDGMRGKDLIAGPVLLAGHSYGAIAAIQAAPVVPEVKGVMAFSGPKDLFAVADTARQLASTTFPRLYPVVRPFFSDAAYRLAVTRAAKRHGFEAEKSSALHAIGRFSGPVFIAHGDRDVDVPVSNAMALRQARLNDTELHLYPGADHWSYLLKEADLMPVRLWVKRVLDRQPTVKQQSTP
jgi:pimeloyl-ACP methyl ester carboxylesterase